MSLKFKRAFILLLLALAAHAQQTLTSVAVLPSDAIGKVLSDNELEALTDEMRAAALKVLPTSAFVLLKQDVVVKRLGGAENYIKICTESSCIVDLGKKAQVDYVSQASVSKLGNRIRLKVELYDVRTEGMVSIINDEAENVRGLFAIVKKRVPAEVFGKIPEVSNGSKVVSPSVAGGISGVQSTGGGYEFEGGKSYLASITTEPEGAVVSFNGAPSTNCIKTPCKLVLGEGNVRIVAALEQYERADTTIFIKQNNQSINIRLKANFGVLEIKPAFLDGIGKNEPWNLTINGKSASSLENRLSPGKYKVELNHRCYETLNFDAGINKGSREVFDISSYVKLKNGGLVLNAERNGEPISEPVFVNGKQLGETPFSGTVPVCAEIELGKIREKVDVEIEHKQTVSYTHRIVNYTPRYEPTPIQNQNPAAKVNSERNWVPAVDFGFGMLAMMNSVNTLYSSIGGIGFVDVEFYKKSLSFFHFGMNLDFGILGSGKMEEEIKQKYPEVDSTDGFDGIVKIGAFTKLYITDFMYVLGGASFGSYSGSWGFSKATGERIAKIPNIYAVAFPVGAGFIFDSGNYVFFLDTQYNITLLKNRVGGYLAFNLGLKFVQN